MSYYSFGFEEGRSATDIPTQEWGADLGLVACSMDVKQAFDNVSPGKPELHHERNGHCANGGRSNFEGTDWRNM